MAQNYDKIDLFFTSRGDFVNEITGDLFTTEGDPLRSLLQEIQTRIKSSLGDWELYPSLGASLEDFVGEPNTKANAEAGKIRIISALTKDGFLNKSDITVQYMTIDIDRILYRLKVKVAPTARNGNSTSLGIRVLYNYKENNTFITS